MIWVAGAGPAANLVMAVGWAVLMRLQVTLGIDEAFFLEMAKAGVFVNIGLMALNLLPVPPLDGGRILIGLLPHRAAVQLARVEPYGLFVVLALMGTRTLGFFLAPFYAFGLAIVDLFL
jgi:Zn-dependent protease